MFSLGVPPSKKSLSSYLWTVEKRMKKILQGIPGFLELTEDVQREIQATNIPEATAMIMARCEMSTGAEQVNHHLLANVPELLFHLPNFIYTLL